jgi:hypothetical protein
VDPDGRVPRSWPEALHRHASSCDNATAPQTRSQEIGVSRVSIAHRITIHSAFRESRLDHLAWGDMLIHVRRETARHRPPTSLVTRTHEPLVAWSGREGVRSVGF